VVLRDTSSGIALGALTGAAVGALVWVSSDHPKDVLTGLAIGGLVGAAAGVAFGLVEGLSERPSPRTDSSALQLTLVLLPDEHRRPTPLPALRGHF
jgi:hypothetical protein